MSDNTNETATPPEVLTDARGRKITIRKINVLDQVKLLRAIGPTQSSNQPYVQIVMMVASVADIDGVPLAMPTNETHIDALVRRIGDEGFAVLQVKIERDLAELNAAAEQALEAGQAPPDPLAPSA